MKLRTSPSDLEALRYYRRVEDPDLDQLLRRLRREEPPNEKMKGGTAFHKCLEVLPDIAYTSEIPKMEADGYIFEMDFPGTVYLPKVREVKAEFQYEVAGVEVTVAMVVDAVTPTTVIDHKLSGKFDPEAYYLESLQWRCYLMAFECSRFIYNVFIGSAGRKNPKHWKIRGYERFDLYRYDGMEKKVMEALEDFVGFAKVHLPEKFT